MKRLLKPKSFYRRYLPRAQIFHQDLDKEKESKMKQWNSDPEHTASTVPTNVPPGAQNVKVFVEPRDQKAPIIDAIKGATSSILLEMYELTDIHIDPNVANALVTAAKNNVKVQVMLFKDAYRFFRPPTTPSYDDVTRLLSAGQPHLQVQENLANLGPHSIKHQKFMVIDDTAAYIMTANLSSSALGGNNREYIIRDTNPQDVQSLISIFQAGWQGSSCK